MMKYSEHLDVLLALISHLGLVDKKSRTPPVLAKYLGFPEEEIRNTLSTFHGIFRKAPKPSKSGQPFYTLQIRYALREKEYKDWNKPDYNPGDSEESGNAIDVSHIIDLMNFVSERAKQEEDREQSLNEFKQVERKMQAELAQSEKQILQAKKASYLALGGSFTVVIVAIIEILSKTGTSC